MHKRNPGIPALPSGLVMVDKGSMRDVIVGIINGDRMPAGGFDVHGLPPNHFRVVEHGNFGVIIGAKHALEVRVILDGELLCEQKLLPMDPPSNPFMDAKVRKMMAESPQPHFVTRRPDGSPFVFKAHTGELSNAEIVHDQFHPLRNAVPPSVDMIDNGGPKTDELIADITPDQVVAMMAKLAGFNPDDFKNGAMENAGVAAFKPQDLLATTTGDQAELPFVEAGEEIAPAPEASAFKCEAVDENPNPPALDLASRHLYWAPSNGLVAVGIRMIQNIEENEPPVPPDAFTYVLFQMNPWSVHTMALAHAANRIILPSREAMAQMMKDEGFEGDAPMLPKVVCACANVRCGGH